MNQETCITEIVEKELRERNAVLHRRLQSAIAALGLLESQYKFHSGYSKMIPVDHILGYIHLKEISMKE